MASSGSLMARSINSLVVQGESLVWHTGLPREGEDRTSPPFSFGGREWCLRFVRRDVCFGEYHTIFLHRLDADGEIEEMYEDLTHPFRLHVHMQHLTEGDKVVGDVEDWVVCETPIWLMGFGEDSDEAIYKKLDWLRGRPEVKFACRFHDPPTIPADPCPHISLEATKEGVTSSEKRDASIQTDGEFGKAGVLAEESDTSERRVHLSTVKDASPPTVDKCVQASTIVSTVDRCVQAFLEIPRDIESLAADISTLLQDESFPDFELKCRGRVFPVHRAVLAARSEVFRAMFRNPMRESESGSADIEGLEVPVLESMIKFVYSGTLEPVLGDETVFQMYQAADKYAVHSLKSACSYWMTRNLTHENCVRFLDAAESHCDRDLRAAVVSFILEHPGVLKTEAWLAFSKKHHDLANEILQMYVTSIVQ